MGREEPVELVSHDARLHANAPRRDVERHDCVEMPPEIDDDAAPDDLTGERRAGAAGDERGAGGGRKPDQLADVGIGFREGHGERPLLILRRIGRIDRAGEWIEQKPAGEAIAEVFEFGGDHRTY